MQAWPLVGRERELGRITEAIARPPPAGIMLVGASGVGKTRLATEALEQVRADGVTVEWAAATEAAASIPFGPVAHLLPHARDDVTSLLDLLRRAADRLAERAQGGRVVVGVDDAHLLDHASAALIHHLVLSSTASVLMTLRTHASPPDAVTALWKDGLVEWLEVKPFSRSELEWLAGVAVGGEVDGSTVRQLWELCRGNALFLRELVVGALEEGTLAQAGELWRARGRLATSTRLTEVIRARLGRMDEDAREAVEVLALGEPLGAAVLEAIVAGPGLEAADRAGLIDAVPDPRRITVRLTHPLYGELLRAIVPPLRRRAICRQLASALQDLGGRRRDDLLRLAVWRMDSGAVADPTLLANAAKQASVAFFDHALAERLARAAVEAGGGAPSQRILAEALFSQGRAEDAEALLAQLERTAGADDRPHIALLRANASFGVSARPSTPSRCLATPNGSSSSPIGGTRQPYCERPLRSPAAGPERLWRTSRLSFNVPNPAPEQLYALSRSPPAPGPSPDDPSTPWKWPSRPFLRRVLPANCPSLATGCSPRSVSPTGSRAN